MISAEKEQSQVRQRNWLKIDGDQKQMSLLQNEALACFVVIPAEAGIQNSLIYKGLDSR